MALSQRVTVKTTDMSNVKTYTALFYLILGANQEYIRKHYDQYELPEVLEHEDHREILKDTKTIFHPDGVIFLKQPREKRDYFCEIFSPKQGLCYQFDDFRVWDEDELNLTLTTHNLPEVGLGEEERSVLVVLVNITQGDYGGGNQEEQLFWHNQMSREEIRKLQSEIMRKYMDPKVDPCQDFYSYACGRWREYFTIPPDRSSYDTFEIIRENLDRVLKNLLEEPTECNNTEDATIKAKLFYQSCMNEQRILERGSEPLITVINTLGGWPLLDTEWNYDLFTLLAKLRLLNNDVLISQWIGPDMKNANQYIIHIDQTSLGLPTKEYFSDPKNVKYVRAYKILIIGGSDVVGIEKDVDDLVDFETSLAQIMASTEERRNISEIYLKTDLSSMTLYFPQYDWETYFNIVLGKVNLRTPVAVYCVKYLLELVGLLSTSRPKTIQNYLIWRFVRHRLNNMDARFLELKQRFNFVLYGREKQPARWQFCVTQTNTHMGMALGSLFVQRYFDANSKQDTIRMTQALIASFKGILEESTWIDPHTKKYARMKIDNMDLKIGFPDFVLNGTELSKRYYDVDVDRECFFENVLSILRHLSRAEQKKLGSQVNRTLWSTSPAVVNAYYSRNKNQIMFPAGILQPPFYHKHFPKALNFGGIGVVIGHEITHGFDDKGRLFDQQGNLMMWWRDSSIRNFYEKAQCMIDQYSQYVLPQIKVPIDGYLTQGENIADNGGLKESFRAYQDWLRRNPEADECLPGLNLTAKQLFFLNFAQVWCGQQRIDEAKNRMKTSVHSPGIFRIIGVLSNSEDFAREFNCPVNSPMNPEKKCAIW